MGFFDKLFGKKKDIDSINNHQVQKTDEVHNGSEKNRIIIKNSSDYTSNNTVYKFARTNRIDINAAIADQIKRHFIAFDIETTGLSPNCDRIVELGAVEYVDGLETRRFSSLVNPGISIPSSATRINHITNDMLQSAASEETIYPSFVDFIKEAITGNVLMCAHNASFDFNFLENTLNRMRIKANIHYVDTLSVCKKNLHGLENYKQSTIEHHFGLVNQESHRAVSDAEICGQILLKAIECGEDKYAQERIMFETCKPLIEELEVCAVIQKILVNSGVDINMLRFHRNTTTVCGTCFYSFIRFKFCKKGRYVILPNKYKSINDLVTGSCTIEEGGINNIRVYFASPLELEQFSEAIVNEYENAYKSAMDYISLSIKNSSEAQLCISGQYQITSEELDGLLSIIDQNDYSSVPIPEIEDTISRDDIDIHPIHNRIPISEIRNLKNESKGFDEGYPYWEQGEILRKEGKYVEAIQLFDKARNNGYSATVLYESYAMSYHKMKDYDNEIDILDEGIERDRIKGINDSKLITRRDLAIKTLVKQKESERLAAIKAEEKKRKQEEKEAQRKAKANESKESTVKRAMLQMDDNGNILAEYSSVAEAAAAVGISTKSIRDAAKGVQKHAAGYCWKYKDL